MAEKYGTIPQKFTREWWDYFWMYYKGYVIAAVFIIITASVTIYQAVTTPKYDLSLVYAGRYAFSDALEEKITETISTVCPDVDSNKKNSLEFLQLRVGDQSDPQYAMAMQTKLDIYIAEENIHLYIFDKDVALPYLGKDAENCCFTPLSDWLDTDSDAVCSAHGIDYGIELTECKVFQEFARESGLDFSGMYLFVRYPPRKDQMKKQLETHNASIEVAQKIVNGIK